MTFSALYVLPALAILILIQGSWISNRAKDMYRSRKHHRRARHRTLFFRALVIALILATALTKAWPLPPLLEIVQGVMITVVIMTPVCVYIVINKLWPQSASDRRDSEASTGDSVDAPDLRPAHASAHLLAKASSNSQKLDEQQQPVNPAVRTPEERAEFSADKPKESLEDSLDQLLKEPKNDPVQESFKEPLNEQLQESFREPPTEKFQESFMEPLNEQLQESFKGSPGEPHTESVEIPLYEALTDAPHTPQTHTKQPASPSAGKNTATTSLHSQSSEQESVLDQTLSVGEQMETLDELVDFHDIGDDDHKSQPAGPYDPDAPPLYNPLEKAIAVARDAILDEPGNQDYSTENLPAKSRIELSEMVVRLRNDKMKLQKLVIAQKAVIDSEKQAHERTRVVVKDAISVMRHARHGQRIAEKIARRERAERQRMEKEYVKVRRALDNALSTVNARSERSEVEKA